MEGITVALILPPVVPAETSSRSRDVVSGKHSTYFEEYKGTADEGQSPEEYTLEELQGYDERAHFNGRAVVLGFTGWKAYLQQKCVEIAAATVIAAVRIPSVSKWPCWPVMLALWGITPQVCCHALDTARVTGLWPQLVG